MTGGQERRSRQAPNKGQTHVASSQRPVPTFIQVCWRCIESFLSSGDSRSRTIYEWGLRIGLARQTRREYSGDSRLNSDHPTMPLERGPQLLPDALKIATTQRLFSSWSTQLDQPHSTVAQDGET